MENKRPNEGGAGGPPRKRPANDIDDMIDDFADEDVEVALQPPDEDVEVELGEAGRNWMRPPVEPFDPATTSIRARGATVLGWRQMGVGTQEGRSCARATRALAGPSCCTYSRTDHVFARRRSGAVSLVIRASPHPPPPTPSVPVSCAAVIAQPCPKHPTTSDSCLSLCCALATHLQPHSVPAAGGGLLHRRAARALRPDSARPEADGRRAHVRSQRQG